MPERSRRFRAAGIDIAETLRPIGVYPGDPTHRSTANSFAKAVLTPGGPGTMRLSWNASVIEWPIFIT